MEAEVSVILLLACNSFVDSPLKFRAPIMLDSRTMIVVLWKSFFHRMRCRLQKCFRSFYRDFSILLFEADQAEFRNV